MPTGLQPVICEPKGKERVFFGKCAFACATHEAAQRWSQFVDVKELLGCNAPTGWFANAVVVVEEPSESIAGCAAFGKLTPLCMLVSLMMEWEVAKLPAMISPHFCNVVA